MTEFHIAGLILAALCLAIGAALDWRERRHDTAKLRARFQAFTTPAPEPTAAMIELDLTRQRNASGARLHRLAARKRAAAANLRERAAALEARPDLAGTPQAAELAAALRADAAGYEAAAAEDDHTGRTLAAAGFQ